MRFVFTLVAVFSFSKIFGQQGEGDLFRILSDEYSALTARYNLVHDAKEEILFSTYIIKGDKIGYANLKLLADAAQRGVRVRMILDDMGNKVPHRILLYLVNRGVEIKIFNKRHWLKPNSIIRRMHGKMLIVDRKYCLVGGRNIDNEYFRMDSLNNFLDREVVIRSDNAVGRAVRHFNAMWEHEVICTDLKGVFCPEDGPRCQVLFDSSAQQVRRQIPLLRQLRVADTISTEDALRPSVNPVHFIHSYFTYKKNGQIRRANRIDHRITRDLLALVGTADSTLDIEAAYFLPTRGWFKALRAAHRRGVRIRVITNSAVSNDVPLIQAIYSNRRKRYQRIGIELYEYCGNRMVHLKAMTIDQETALIGSYNLERKSEKYNTEVAAWVNDPFLAGKQQTLFEKYLLNCKPAGAGCPNSSSRSETEKKRKRRVAWMRYTIAPIAGLVL